MTPTRYVLLPSPVGTLLISTRSEELFRIEFQDGTAPLRTDSWELGTTPLLSEATKQVTAWFDGRLQRFDLPLSFEGTGFQVAVWQAVADIPFAQTRSYSEIAQQIARPKAVRAVGAANGRNPLPLVVPCHRVIGKGGRLTGFRGGLPIKRQLLDFEARRVGVGNLQLGI